MHKTQQDHNVDFNVNCISVHWCHTNSSEKFGIRRNGIRQFGKAPYSASHRCILRYQVNVLALCICSREAIKMMKEHSDDEGQIIQINRFTDRHHHRHRCRRFHHSFDDLMIKH